MMKTILQKITPKMAEKMLEKNRKNRPIRKGVVEKIAKDMALKIKAYDAMMSGRKMKALRFGADEEFPYVLEV